MIAYQKQAIDSAIANPILNLPRMGAVLVLRNGDIFYGYNQQRSHPFQKQWAKHPEAIFLHAEIDALIRAMKMVPDEMIVGSSIYIARVLKNGQPALAKPCSGCLGALIHFGVDNIWWTE